MVLCLFEVRERREHGISVVDQVCYFHGTGEYLLCVSCAGDEPCILAVEVCRLVAGSVVGRGAMVFECRRRLAAELIDAALGVPEHFTDWLVLVCPFLEVILCLYYLHVICVC